MSGETVITHIGNLVAPVELKYTPAGVAVANFTVAATPRTFDKQAGEWRDGEALFLRCNIWREPAENLANSELVKGTRVIVCGRLKQRTYETKEGEKRYVTELDVEEVGPALKWATVKVARADRKPAGGAAPLAEGQPLDPPF